MTKDSKAGFCLAGLLQSSAAVGWGSGWHATQLLHSGVSFKKLLSSCVTRSAVRTVLCMVTQHAFLL